MSVTQVYKNDYFSIEELVSIETALEDRIDRLRTSAANGNEGANELIERAEAALAKVRAAL